MCIMACPKGYQKEDSMNYQWKGVCKKCRYIIITTRTQHLMKYSVNNLFNTTSSQIGHEVEDDDVEDENQNDKITNLNI